MGRRAQGPAARDTSELIPVRLRRLAAARRGVVPPCLGGDALADEADAAVAHTAINAGRMWRGWQQRADITQAPAAAGRRHRLIGVAPLLRRLVQRPVPLVNRRGT